MNRQHDEKVEQSKISDDIAELEQEVNQAEAEAAEELDALAAAEAKATEHWDRLLRVQAELENIKRRSERDLANAHKFAIEKFVKDLFPVMDGLEMALKTLPNEGNKALIDGVELTHKIFLDCLVKHGIKQVDPEGEPFDPVLHEAVSAQENAEVEADTVVSVLQKGYTLQGRLVRPALVVVAR